MPIIRNKGNKDLKFSWDFNTYTFPKGKMVFVSKELYEFVIDRWPLAFDFNIELKDSKGVPEVKKEKSPSLIKTQPVNTNQSDNVSVRRQVTFSDVDNTPASGTTDKDGVGWYGEGLEIEGKSHSAGGMK